ncbi:MAG: hypothetical protein J6S86_04220 [Alphaproteobacteria bacterium]|nr:hypothetical protein [Alphaproteobacteria bacterium]
MKRVYTLIFGLTILGLASSGANADSYHGNYDSRRPYDDYNDRTLDFRGYHDKDGTYNAYPVRNSESYELYLRDQDLQREIERLRKIEEQKRLEDQKKYEEYQAAEKQKRLEEQRALEEWRKAEEQKKFDEQRELDEFRRAKEQEKLRRMENLGKQFEIFLKSKEQNGLSLSPEQQRERKIQQMHIITSIQEKIQNEKLRQSENKKREQEKINRIVPLKWQAKRKVKELAKQLSEINLRMKNLIQNVQDNGISKDPNLGFVQRSIEFCCEGIRGFLGSSMQNSSERSISSKRNTDDDKTLTNGDNDLYRRQEISRNSLHNRTNTQELPGKRVSRSIAHAAPAA